MRYQIKELGLGGILDQAITLVKNHFALLMGIVLVLFFPFTLALNFFITSSMQGMQALQAGAAGGIDMAAQQKAASGMLIMFPLLFLYQLVIVPLTNAAIIHAVASEYLERPVTVGQSISRAFRVLLPLLGTTILFGLIVYAGLLLCIIPGVIWLFQNILYGHVVVIEGLSGMPALRRSKQLMLSDRTKHFNTIFLLGLVLGIVNFASGAVAGLIPEPHVATAVTSFVQSVLMLLGTAAGVVFYFSCRCKAENFDLTLLAQSVAAEDGGGAGGGDFVQE